jgi:hypothetical protein
VAERPLPGALQSAPDTLAEATPAVPDAETPPPPAPAPEPPGVAAEPPLSGGGREPLPSVGEEPPLPGEEPPSGDEAAGKVFVVENGTSQDLQVFFDGVAAGSVGAGETQRFTNLPGIRFTPSARSASGAREFRHPPVDMGAQQSFTWIIEP